MTDPDTDWLWAHLPGIDRVALLKPISRQQPAGPSPRDTGVSDGLKKLRRAQDWPALEAAALEALSGACKDLELAAWLTEGWLHQRGAAGLAAGLDLIASYAERYWDSVHPLPEGGDILYRLGPLEWLDRLGADVQILPLSAAAGTPGVAPVTLYDGQKAQYLAQLAIQDPKQHQKLVREQAARDKSERPSITSLEEIDLSLRLTPDDWLLDAAGLFALARAALDRLVLAVGEEDAGNSFSGLPALYAALEGCCAFLDHAVRARSFDAVPEPEPAPDEAAPFLALSLPAEPELAPASIRSRAEAYRRLAEIADYLQRSEPHSPTPYLIRRAIAWGGMSLPALLAELMESGEGDLQRLRRLLGLP